MKRNKGAILLACSLSAVLTLTSCNVVTSMAYKIGKDP
jgi:hypothetical protein